MTRTVLPAVGALVLLTMAASGPARRPTHGASAPAPDTAERLAPRAARLDGIAAARDRDPARRACPAPAVGGIRTVAARAPLRNAS